MLDLQDMCLNHNWELLITVIDTRKNIKKCHRYDKNEDMSFDVDIF